jgi:hypothetical protein
MAILAFQLHGRLERSSAAPLANAKLHRLPEIMLHHAQNALQRCPDAVYPPHHSSLNFSLSARPGLPCLAYLQQSCFANGTSFEETRCISHSETIGGGKPALALQPSKMHVMLKLPVFSLRRSR